MTTSYNRNDRWNQMKQLRAERLSTGAVIKGIWNKRSYRVERCLGHGSNGVVYMVTAFYDDPSSPAGGTRYALKMGADTIEFQSEINAVRSLDQEMNTGMTGNSNKSPLPYLIEADDWEGGDGKRPFYVMRYIAGESVLSFIRSRGLDWFGPTGVQILQRIMSLHERGWIFGDLKMEHVKVKANGEVDLIDYGGLTQLGKSVKQFTEWYDRGFWNAGPRAADIGYDLFSFSVMAVHLCQDKRFKRVINETLPQTRTVDELIKIIENCPVLSLYRGWFSKALTGRFNSTREAYTEWQRITRQVGKRMPIRYVPTPSWLKWSFGFSLFLLLISLGYWAWNEGWLFGFISIVNK